jgi:uncharacterized protein YciI
MSMRWFLVTRARGPRFDHSRRLEEQEQWVEHADFMNALEREGFVVLGGPVLGTDDALLVVRASDAQEVERRLAVDPWTRNELLRIASIREWQIRLGTLG